MKDAICDTLHGSTCASVLRIVRTRQLKYIGAYEHESIHSDIRFFL